MEAIWQFVSDPANRETLAWLGGGVCVVAAGLWVVVKHFAASSPPDPQAPPSPRAAARDGIAAGGNVTAGRDVVVGDIALPRMALGLAALGFVLFALALVFGGGDETTGSVTAGGDISDSNITIGGPVPTDD